MAAGGEVGMSVGVGFSGAGRRTGRRAAAQPGAALALALLCVLAGGALGQDAGEGGNLRWAGLRTGQLFGAVMIRNERLVRNLVADGADINGRRFNGSAPLHTAARFHFLGNKGVVNALVELGADLETRDEDGQTPFLEAVESGNEYMVRLLAAADIKAVDRRGRTALHLIAPPGGDLFSSVSYIDGRKRVARSLIRAGLDLESLDADGRSPLHAAAGNGRGRVFARILLEAGAFAGAEVQGAEMKGATALHLASEKGNLGTVRLLLSPRFGFGLDIDATTDSGRTALSLAAENGHAKVVRRLLAAGAATKINGGVLDAWYQAFTNKHWDVADTLRKSKEGGLVPRCMIAARGLLGI